MEVNMTNKPQNIDEYVSQFPLETQEKLHTLLSTLVEVVPEAEIGLKWGVPAFTYRRVLFTVAASKSHINFYPTPDTSKAFTNKLKNYPTTKRFLQLQLNQPLPTKLNR